VVNSDAAAQLTAQEMQLWRSFLVWNETVLSAVARELLSQTGLTTAEFQILVRVSESPTHTLEQRHLASSLQLSATRLSHQLSRMQAREQITRQSPGAGHVVVVTITEMGLKLVSSALSIHAKAVRRSFLEPLLEHQREALNEIVTRAR
jgi:DNA-binding MarR family transcriptional regulator